MMSKSLQALCAIGLVASQPVKFPANLTDLTLYFMMDKIYAVGATE